MDMEFDELTFIATSMTTVFTLCLIIIILLVLASLKRIDTILILSTTTQFNGNLEYIQAMRDNNLIY